MSGEIDNNNEENMLKDDSKKEHPLSVRVGHYYKDIFNELSNRPGYNKKNLLETMIYQYVKREEATDRRNYLNLDHEISLITQSLDDVLRIFKTLSVKAQDTIGSNKTYYEQQVENLNTKIKTMENQVLSAEDEKNRLDVQSKSIELKYDKLSDEKKKLEEKLEKLEVELRDTKEEKSKVLNEVYNLRNIQGENIELNSKNSKLLEEIERIKDIVHKADKQIADLKDNLETLEKRKQNEIETLALKNKNEVDALENKLTLLNDQLRNIQVENNDLNSKKDKLLEDLENLKGIVHESDKQITNLKDSLETLEKKKQNEVDALQSKITVLSDQLNDIYNKKEQELNEIEARLRKEIEVEFKMELLESKSLYNSLQMEHLKTLNQINEKDEEINRLKAAKSESKSKK